MSPKELPVDYKSIAPQPPEGDLHLEALLGNGPFDLEIGYGRGRFLIERASHHVERKIIGIEVKAKLADKVAKRCEKLGLANATVWYADAKLFLPRVKQDELFSFVFINFPDPWWKKRHGKRRVLDDTTLNALARLLRKDGILFIQTDVEDRALEMARSLVEHSGFCIAAGPSTEVVNRFEAQSNREARADKDGLPVWRLYATRAS